MDMFMAIAFESQLKDFAKKHELELG